MKVPKENSDFKIKSAKTKKKMEADPSFSKDSPSITIFNLIFAPVDFKIATTATGSVAAKMELNDKAIPQLKTELYPNTYMKQRDIRKMETTTAGKANRRICQIDFINVWESAVNEDSKMRRGMKISKSE
jgi:hypothetical protein